MGGDVPPPVQRKWVGREVLYILHRASAKYHQAEGKAVCTGSHRQSSRLLAVPTMKIRVHRCRMTAAICLTRPEDSWPFLMVLVVMGDSGRPEDASKNTHDDGVMASCWKLLNFELAQSAKLMVSETLWWLCYMIQ